MRGLLEVLGVSALGIFCGSCETPGSHSLREHRATVVARCQETLEELYARAPEARAGVEAAPGYAVLRQGGLQVPLPGTGKGYGVAVDNRNGKRTFLRTSGLGTDASAGLVVVFATREMFTGFVAGGRELGSRESFGLRVYRVGDAVVSATRCWIDRVLDPSATQSPRVRLP